MKFWIIFLALVELVLSAPSAADTRTVNEDLSSQVKAVSDRMLPCAELYCMAIDGHLFYRDLAGDAGYYHGGYWLDNFFQVTPTENLSLNAKVAVYNPAASYGIVATTYVLPFVGVGWKDNLSNYGITDTKVNIRYFDLDRQTVAAGLTLNEKEMSGLLVQLQQDAWAFKFIFDGTGGFEIGGDFFDAQLDFFHNWLGVAVFVDSGQPADPTTSLVPNQSLFYSLYSIHAIVGGLRYAGEASFRNDVGAGMLKLGWTNEDRGSALSLNLNLQARYYGLNYADGIKGHIQHDYVSIEQEDKPFTDSMNIFSLDDNLMVYAAMANLDYQISPKFILFSDNEFANFAYRDIGGQAYYFYRSGISVCPKQKTACANFFVSNKQVNADVSANNNDTENKMLFIRKDFLGMEARFKF